MAEISPRIESMQKIHSDTKNIELLRHGLKNGLRLKAMDILCRDIATSGEVMPNSGRQLAKANMMRAALNQ